MVHFQVHYQLDVLFPRDFFSLKGTIREGAKGLLNKPFLSNC